MPGDGVGDDLNRGIERTLMDIGTYSDVHSSSTTYVARMTKDEFDRDGISGKACGSLVIGLQQTTVVSFLSISPR